LAQIPFGTLGSSPSADLSASTIQIFVLVIGLGVFIVILVLRLEKELRLQRESVRKRGDVQFAGGRPYLAVLKNDMHPKSWLSKFSQVSVKHLVLMSVFYHIVSIGLMITGDIFIALLDPNYVEPEIPVSFIPVVLAGPIEETIAFGIPTYLSSNPYVVLVTGSLWAISHIFNTDTLSVSTLAYPTVLFAIPHIFLSLRTWASGKGWFAILLHSAWNGMAFAAACGLGDIQCAAFGSGELAGPFETHWIAGLLILAEVLFIVTYMLYYRRSRNEIVAENRRAGLSIPTLAIIGGMSYAGGSIPFQNRPSKLYYLPLIAAGVVSGYLGLFAGIAMYFTLRNRDRGMALNGLLIGVIFFVAKFFLRI
jgi:hypothetical protein